MSENRIGPKGFVFAVFAPVFWGFILTLAYLVRFAVTDPGDFSAYWSVSLVATAMTVFFSILLSSLGCLLIGVPLHKFLKMRHFTSFRAYLSAGTLVGMVLASLAFSILEGSHLDRVFRCLVSIEIVTGSALSAATFWWFSQPRSPFWKQAI